MFPSMRSYSAESETDEMNTEYYYENKNNKHNAELQRTAPNTKDKGAFSTKKKQRFRYNTMK